MNTLPERSNIDHLRKQAKDLLREYRSQDPIAFARFRTSLPAAQRLSDGALIALDLRLHDAQSAVAREYGFESWAELKSHLELQSLRTKDHAETLSYWLHLVYAGDLSGGSFGSRPAQAARLLAQRPELVRGDPYVACAVGDEPAIREAIAADPNWVNSTGGPLKLVPLVAVTHSSLVRLDAFREPLRNCVRVLLDAGADPDSSVGNRWPPHSLENPGEDRLTAIYGAAGQNHDIEMTKMLLAAGADPNDNESLYHAIDDIECVRLLLENGARIQGTNALGRALDFDNPKLLQLLLENGANANELVSGTTPPILWAIRRTRSAAHIKLLLDAGANASVDLHGVGAYRLALAHGMTEAAELLKRAGAADDLTDEDRFIAACARGDEQEARRIQATHPGLPGSLPQHVQSLLPLMAANGNHTAVMTMVKLGWPIAARGADIGGSALNAAVFNGDVALTRFLLEHGASWTERHNYNSNVTGTLGWASCNRPRADGDWLGCAKELVKHGMPRAQRPPDASQDPDQLPRHVLMDGHLMTYPEDITEFLLSSDAP